MLGLGIDTSTPMVSVAVVRYDPSDTTRTGSAVDELARRDELVHNAHGEVLAVLLQATLRGAGVAPGDLDVIGTGLGPGPFTGLRAGIVTAAAMSDALEIPAYGMCSLDAIAAAYDTGEHPFAVVTDARRRQVYWALYAAGGIRQEGPEISTPTELTEHLHGRVEHITGSATAEHRDALAGFRLSEPRWPVAVDIAADALARLWRGEPPRPLVPLYLRRPDARPPGAPKKVMPA